MFFYELIKEKNNQKLCELMFYYELRNKHPKIM